MLVIKQASSNKRAEKLNLFLSHPEFISGSPNVNAHEILKQVQNDRLLVGQLQDCKSEGIFREWYKIKKSGSPKSGGPVFFISISSS